MASGTTFQPVLAGTKKSERLTAVGAVILAFPFAVLAFVGWAVLYSKQQLARQYRDGPWEISTIRSVEMLHGRGGTRFQG